MATCSFLKATDAINLSRNNTIIWTEICELQKAILAAIDNNEREVTVSSGTPFTFLSSIDSATLTAGGAGYSIDSATAVINANGTGGTGAVLTPSVSSTGAITGFTVENGGSGYTPVSPTASLAVPYSLSNGQTDTSYNGAGTEGTFIPGVDYFVGEAITLSNSAVVTVVAIDGGQQRYLVQSGQTHIDYDNVSPNGTFSGGTGFTAQDAIDGDTITLNDGTVITIVAVAGGAVTQFTVTTGSTVSTATSGFTRGQVSTTASGTGFTLTPGTANETLVGPVSQFSVNSGGATNFFLTQQLAQTSTTGIGTTFSLTPNTGNGTPVPHAGTEAVLTPYYSNGSIISVEVNSGGTGYTDQNPVFFTVGSGATAVANVVGGVIQSVTVITGGIGYETKGPLITVNHSVGFGFEGIVQVADGEQAVLRVDITGGSVTSVTLVNGGSGYANGFGLTFSLTTTNGGTAGTDAVITYDVVSGSITSPTITTAGTGYSDGSNILVTDTPESPGSITGVSIQDGGTAYSRVYPYVVVTDSTGSGAQINVTGVTDAGALETIQLVAGGANYSAPITTIYNYNGTQNGTATIALTLEADTFNNPNDPGDYYLVLQGQASDRVVQDQLQYVLDYFTALGYNIRAQVNPATNNTIQWQIIW